MRFKLIVAMVEVELTDAILDAARQAGATGSTVINHARGEGLNKTHGIFGMEITAQRDMLLFLSEEHRSRHILEAISQMGEFDETPGTGIAFQLDVEDAVGVKNQIQSLTGQPDQL
ncbi:P-II family nitrogen regulator [Halomonas sp. QX-2]|jgi:nitrogen regulatory protein PII|uniref:P-II family nitrogen regulator n=1 Tax=Vreelandella sedimenti TaxID=2729618 RepID=A0A7Z0SMK1_9GAMM|nr:MULTISPECIES: P-II family nitrogen regulator [Halomonas]NYT72920.1 P-II family nitrogen regulator [Halomonas sedimenti]|tara:strand:- start:8211 stop:8558 length:348 start_codon:yes stop_codon:yes gene_type:complete